jgi:phosphoribosylformimino-5-aminoimidazole carboxamide ribotide isomerase
VIVVPAIDLRGGRVVRLVEGDPSRQTEYGRDPAEVARRFESAGAALLHVVDLDGALDAGTGRDANEAAVAAICRSVSIPVQVGGGLRSGPDVNRVVEAGAARVVLGTTAVARPGFVAEVLDAHGPDRVVVALDVRAGRVMVEGWRSAAGPLESVLRAMDSAGAPRYLVTGIEMDGTLRGPDVELYRKVLGLTTRPVLASGGVRDAGDVGALAALGLEGVVVGKALYEGTLSLRELRANLQGEGRVR